MPDFKFVDRRIASAVIALALLSTTATADGLGDATKGQQALDAGNYTAAIGLFTKALAEGLPSDARELALLKRAHAFARNFNVRVAIMDLDRARALMPDDPEIATLRQDLGATDLTVSLAAATKIVAQQAAAQPSFTTHEYSESPEADRISWTHDAFIHAYANFDTSVPCSLKFDETRSFAAYDGNKIDPKYPGTPNVYKASEDLGLFTGFMVMTLSDYDNDPVRIPEGWHNHTSPEEYDVYYHFDGEKEDSTMLNIFAFTDQSRANVIATQLARAAGPCGAPLQEKP